MAEMNIREALLMATEIEKAVKEFYVRSSLSVASQELRILFHEISKDETSHILQFTGLYEETPQNMNPNASGYSSDFLIHLIDLEPILKKLEHMPTTVDGLLEAAIETEKNSILFYTELKNHLLERHSHDAIEKILHDEKRHFVSLSEKLKDMAGLQ